MLQTRGGIPCDFQFPGQGQREQPVITLEGALKLITWLPGNMAKDYRSKACGITWAAT